MVQFECHSVIHPLVSFTFGVLCRLPFYLYMQEKGDADSMWLLKKVQNFQRILKRAQKNLALIFASQIPEFGNIFGK